METIFYNNYRIEILTNDLVRIEYSKVKKFVDVPTFFIINRNFDEQIEHSFETKNGCNIYLKDYLINIPEDSKNLKGISVLKNKTVVFNYKKMKNSGELPLPNKTKEVFALIDSPRMICPSEGYSTKNIEDESYKIEENANDIYLFLINKDFRRLRKLYIELTGKASMVRYSNLGVWNSRYYEYNEEEAKNMIKSYKFYNIPLDNMVIDTDWRAATERGIGYEINLKLFPDLNRFFNFAHNNNVEIMFNDHPEPVEGAKSALSKKEIEYREKNLTALFDLGLDTWWYDRNWTTKLISPNKNLCSETLGIYLFSDITKHYFNATKTRKYARRPVVMGNIIDIRNGNYLQIMDSASHRYPFEWSGDICSDESQIVTEIESMLKCENNLISYFNSDLGGHTGNPDKETFIKWIKYGAFSPIFRPHATKNVIRFREPWNYDDETVNIFRNYVNLRQRLTPYLYANCFRNYIEGEPLIKPLSFNYNGNKKAEKLTTEYLFGDDILIANDAKNRRRTLQKANFVDKIHVEFFDNTELKNEPILIKEYDNFHFSLNGKSVEKEVPVTDFSMKVSTKISFKDDVNLYVATDDGVRVYLDGKLVVDSWVNRSKAQDFIAQLNKNQIYEIYIEYFQGKNEAEFELSYEKLETINDYKVYFPEEYFDVFKGKICKKNTTVTKKSNLFEYGIFVKLGSTIPIFKNANSLKEQTFNEILFDVYPSKTQSSTGFIYEDDRETVAYEDGKYNISKYSTFYNEEEGIFNLLLNKTIVKEEKIFTKNKKITIKFNLIGHFKKISKIFVNGNEVEFKVNTVNENDFVLDFKNTSKTNKTATFEIKIDSTKDYLIQFKK